MGRRYGKTVLGGVIVANVLRQHGKAAWVVPTYKNSRPLWRWINNVFQPLEPSKLVSISKSEQAITTSKGGFFAIYSEENIDSIRGEWFHVVVNDEAAKFREESRYDAIEPVVSDSDGEIIDISTPRGRNWFWREYVSGGGSDRERKSFHAPTSDNPLPNIRKAFDRARQTMSDHTFRQEWLAEFIDDSGGVFRNVTELSTLPAQEKANDEQQIIFGVDWGKSNDFTVISAIDVATRQQVYLDRFNQIDYHVQMGRLQAAYERLKPISIVVESNSIGTPLIEQMVRLNLPVRPFTTTNATKATIIDSLALAMERREVQLIDDQTQIAELQSYEMNRLPSGLMRYSAPDGMHDDTVMALAFAWYGSSVPSADKLVDFV